jgi:hypothetical protein
MEVELLQLSNKFEIFDLFEDLSFAHKYVIGDYKYIQTFFGFAVF